MEYEILSWIIAIALSAIAEEYMRQKRRRENLNKRTERI
jgi:hypothetical protein